MWFSGFRRGVLPGILGRRRGANGRFCHGIPGFLAWVRGRRGDSAHGGHCRDSLAKKFLKKGVKKGEKPKNWGARGAGRRSRSTLYRVCGGDFLGPEAKPLAALLEVRFVQVPQLRAPAMRSQRNTRDSLLLYMENRSVSSIAHLMEVSPLVRPAIL